MLNNLKSLIFHQRQLKEHWDSLASPTKVRSILGMIPEYSYIEKILSSKRHANPALTSGLHEIDQLTLGYLRQTILLIRNEHFGQIREWIEHTKSFLNKENHKELVQRCDAVQQLYNDELEYVGLTG